MTYTEDQIKKYLEILHNYNKPDDVIKKVRCSNCQGDSFCLNLVTIYVNPVEQLMVMY